jgi:predicted dehydrogenase
MSNALTYIIVGTGGFGGQWVQNFLPRLTELGKARPVAAVDVRPENLAHVQEHLGLPPARQYTDAACAFEENPADFAIVVVPPAHHESIIDLALAHDMDILCEKPITDTMAGCCRVYKKVRQAGRKMAVTMSHRMARDKQTLEAAVKSGRYGRPHYVVGRFTDSCRHCPEWGEFRYRIDDPLLIEGTVHHFDILRALTGSDAKTVFVRSWKAPWSEFQGDDTALIVMEMTNGTRAMFEGAVANASTLNGWTNEYFRAECDSGTLVLDHQEVTCHQNAAWQPGKVRSLPLLEGEVWMNALLAEQFVDWLNGGDPPATCLDDNIQCAAILFAAIQSARTGQIVDVQEFLQKHLEDGQ